MPKSIAKESFAKKSLEGFEKGREEYRDLSGWDWFYSTKTSPEYMVTVSIAQQLLTLRKERYFFLTLEESVGNILRWADTKRMTKELKESEQQKFDMVVWWARDQPRGIVEVKTCVTQSRQPVEKTNRPGVGLYGDAYRIVKCLSRKNSLQFGMVVYDILKDNARSVSNEAWIKKLKKEIWIDVKTLCDKEDLRLKRVGGSIELEEDDLREFAYVSEALLIWKPNFRLPKKV